MNRLSMHELSSALEQTADMVLITDRSGTIEYVNRAFVQATGFASEELIGATPGLLYSGYHDHAFYQGLWQTIRDGKAFRGTVVNKRKDGTLYFEEKTITPLTAPTGEITHYVSTGKDVTEQRKREEELSKLSLAVEQSVNAIIVTDLQGRIEYINNHFCEVSGYSKEEVIGNTPGMLKSGQHPASFYQEMWATITRGQVWRGEIANRKKNGELYWEEVSISPVRNSDGRISHFVGVQEDITERRDAERRLNFLAYYDSLTRLPNRLMLQHELDQCLKAAQRNHETVAVLFVDLDRFKDINDSLGHEEGDNLLCQVAKRLSSNLRDEDTVSRVGGDEFIIILSHIKRPAGVGRVASKLLNGIKEPFILAGRKHFISASIGISLYPQDHTDAAELMKNADVAMYQAKTKGCGNYQFYSHDMGRRVLERMQIEQRMRLGIGQDQFLNFYQPQFDLQNHRLTGCEALLRWQHPQHGLIGPGRFIPVAEENGEILRLGEQALQQACAQMQIWQQSGLEIPRVSVNLSPHQLARPDLPKQIEKILQQSGLNAGSLVLELTESAVMRNPELSRRLLKQLKALGVQLALDDFGTGYSSLSYLRRFPFDCLKIDRSFVQDLPDDVSADAVASAIISLAHSLGMSVVAEGVETLEQLDFLRDAGCDIVQGYLTGRPVPAAKAATWDMLPDAGAAAAVTQETVH